MPQALQKTLNFPTLLLIAINAIMGTGIFFLPALGAREAGTASIISWAILSVISIYVAMCFAELAGMFPKSGGIYEYCKQAFGTLPSFLVGWGTLVAANITIAMLMVGAVRYLNPALPPLMKIAISLFFILTFNYIAFRGMELSAVMLVTFSMITMGSLLAIIVPGLFNMSTANLTPVFTHDLNHVFVAMFLIAETFFGWETITFLSEETKDPTRTVPKVLILSTIFIALICLAYVVTSIGSVGWQNFGEMSAPIAALSSIYYGSSASSLFTILTYLAILGSVSGWIVSSPRLLLSLAEDKLFLSQLADVHPTHKTPHKAILFQTVLTSLLVVIGSGSYETLLSILLPLVLLLYSAVLVGLVILRYRRPSMKRTYKAPLGEWLPLVVVVCIFSLIIVWLSEVSGAFHLFRLMISMLILGLPIYLLLIFYYNPDAIIKMTDKLSFLTRIFDRVIFPRRIRREMIDIFRNLEGKTVLEFGAGVGTLTLEIAEKVLPGGKVIATELSERNSRHILKKVREQGHNHVEVIHDRHQVNRVHPTVKSADVVFSVGMLSYLQDVKKVLGEIANILPETGRVCFVEYIDFFRVLPDPDWLNNEKKVKAIFRDAGFSVKVKKKRGILWNYLIVYGFKSEEDVPFV